MTDSLQNSQLQSAFFTLVTNSGREASSKDEENRSIANRGEAKKCVAKLPPKNKDSSQTADSVRLDCGIPIASKPSYTAVVARIVSEVNKAKRRNVAQFRLKSKTTSTESENIHDHFIQKASPFFTVPQVVEVGLVTIFEIIHGSYDVHPLLCFQALEALFYTLQGQNLEALKCEPWTIMEKLCTILMQITTCGRQIAMDSSDVLVRRIQSSACSCLVSLVLSWGRTEKLFLAVKTILTSSQLCDDLLIKVPQVLVELQRTTLGSIFRTSHMPVPFQIGILDQSRFTRFQCNNEALINKTIRYAACDGECIYLLLNDGSIVKIGTGYNYTEPGRIYAISKITLHQKFMDMVEPPVSNIHQASLHFLYCKGYLYVLPRQSTPITIDAKTLKRQDMGLHVDQDALDGIWFSDGSSLGLLHRNHKDAYLVHFYSVADDKKLIRDGPPLHINPVCTRIIAFGDVSKMYRLKDLQCILDHNCSDIEQIVCGRDFQLHLLRDGQVMHTGNQESVGIKQPSKRLVQPSLLGLPLSVRIKYISAAPNGEHALLVSDNGEVFFVGTSHRGEDGITMKNRRVSKQRKVRKMVCMESKIVVQCACNVGTSALVTKDGHLYMFGKDSTHVNVKTGQVTDLKGVKIKQVSLGKAHVVAVTRDGKLYTFGVNNKGQCGRQDPNLTMAERIAEIKLEKEKDVSMLEEDERSNENAAPSVQTWQNIATPCNNAPICSPSKHKWAREECRICAVCQECTGYGSRCINSRNQQRVPRLSCGCGAGDSGCTACGCCKTCASEADVKGIHEDQGRAVGDFNDKKEQENPMPVSPWCAPKKYMSVVSSRPAASLVLSEADILKEASKIAMLPPCRVVIGNDRLEVVEAACGAHHSVVLLENGMVFTFGLNSFGQLGLGDTKMRNQPCEVHISERIKSIAAGSFHTVMLSVSGRFFVCGKATFLDTEACTHLGVAREYFVSPQLVDLPRITWISASHDVTFVKFGEMLLDAERFEDTHVLASNKYLMVVKSCDDIATVEKCRKEKVKHVKFSCGNIVIDKKNGLCHNFTGPEQLKLNSSSTVCLDASHDVIWSISSEDWSFEAHALHGNGACFKDKTKVGYLLMSPFSPQLAMPLVAEVEVPCSHAAVNILWCLNTLLTTAPAGGTSGLTNRMESMEGSMMGHATRLRFTNKPSEVYVMEDFSSVTRFKSNGGGWGYSAHSVEAIRFSCDTEILLGGCGVYGGRGEYTVAIKVYGDGEDSDEEVEAANHLILETNNLPYECGYREKFKVLFEEPIFIAPGQYYTISAKISGPSSDCGSHGESQVLTEDNVKFTFRRSKLSNNGTDVAAGQIPDFLYALPPWKNVDNYSQEMLTRCISVQVVSEEFYARNTQGGLQPLLFLLQWGWEKIVAMVGSCVLKQDGIFNSREGLLKASAEVAKSLYVCVSCLELLKGNISSIHKVSGEDFKECNSLASECCELVSHILTEKMISSVDWEITAGEDGVHECSKELSDAVSTILQQCRGLLCSCVNIFYPSPVLKWNQLNNVIRNVETDDKILRSSVQRLLSVYFDALCHPSIDLVQCLPLFPRTLSNLQSVKSLTSSPTSTGKSCDLSADSTPSSKGIRYECASSDVSLGSLQDMTRSVVDIISQPVHDIVKHGIDHDCDNLIAKELPDLLRCPADTVVSSASHFVIALVQELCFKANEVPLSGLTMLCEEKKYFLVASRFSRLVTNRCWNTGNGSPDAVCFTVSQSGVLLVGFGVYGGGGDHTYEIEIMQQIKDVGDSDASTSSQVVRWETLQLAKGTYKTSDCDEHNTAHIMFGVPVQLRENCVYAVRLHNHGERTYCGEQGSCLVQGPDGTEFRFMPCAQSSNGTSVVRGQIPCVLYTRNQADDLLRSPDNDWIGTATTAAKSRAIYEKQALDVLRLVVQSFVDVLPCLVSPEYEKRTSGSKCTLMPDLDTGVANSSQREQKSDRSHLTKNVTRTALVADLLPQLFQAIGTLVRRSPHCAIEALSIVRQLLPPLMSTINIIKSGSEQPCIEARKSEKNLIVVVESDHPYKPASAVEYEVCFPSSVGFMVLEFSAKCQTAQAEDVVELLLQLDENSQSQVSEKREQPRVLKKMFQDSNWPRDAVILPGNKIIFSLKTASDYGNMKEKRPVAFYGFHCTVTGLEMSLSEKSPGRGLVQQVTAVAALSCVTLMKAHEQLTRESCNADSVFRSFAVSPSITSTLGNEELSECIKNVEHLAGSVIERHQHLFRGGLNIKSVVDVTQALSGDLPLAPESVEKKFLMDFIAASTNTSGGRLARWLQPDSYIDPTHCDLLLDHDGLIENFPVSITIITKDQYGHTVNVPSLTVKLTAKPLPINDVVSNEVMTEQCYVTSVTPSEPPPTFEANYEPTRHRDSVYHSISMMRAYRRYSFEELRLIYPWKHVLKKESILVASVGKGVYSAAWIPMHATNYLLAVTFDHELKGPRKHVVVASPAIEIGNRMRSAFCHKDQNKKMKFAVKSSLGLRIRSNPTLQSQQVGILKFGDVIDTMEELRNTDGLWVKLSEKSKDLYCTQCDLQDAWCLAFHNHYNKVLLATLDNYDKEKNAGKSHSTSIRQKNQDHDFVALPGPPASLVGRKSQLAISSACSTPRHLVECEPGMMIVTKCGGSGHNVRCKASSQAAVVGKLNLGDRVNTTSISVVGTKAWVRLDTSEAEKYCSDSGYHYRPEAAAWILAVAGGTHFLESIKCIESGKASINSTILQIDPFTVKTREESALEGFDRLAKLSAFDKRVGQEYKEEQVYNKTKDRKVEQPLQQQISRWPMCNDNRLSSVRRKDSPSRIIQRDNKAHCRSSSPVVPKEYESKKPTGMVFSYSKSVAEKSVEIRASGVQVVHARSTSAGLLFLKDIEKYGLHHHRSHSAPVSLEDVWKNGKDPTSAVSPQKDDLNKKELSKVVRGEVLLSEQVSGNSVVSATNVMNRNMSCMDEIFDEEGNITSPSSPEALKTATSILSKGSVDTKDAATPKHVPRVKKAELWMQPSGQDDKTALLREGNQVQSLNDMSEALSPLAAECSRAVFAAFLWHEGIVHDAMTCSSYIRFSSAKKEELNGVRNQGFNSHCLVRTCSVDELPVTLYHLSSLWEDISTTVIDVAIKNPPLSSSVTCAANSNCATSDAESKHHGAMKEQKMSFSESKETQYKQNMPVPRSKVTLCGVARLNHTKMGHSGIGQINRQGAECELCGKDCPYPVTYHMKKMHKGCGKFASGFGYNSSGHYCGGWAGDCGDGGDGASTWYLLCMKCKEKYRLLNKDSKAASVIGRKQSIKTRDAQDTSLSDHQIMKDNAMFLLELCGGSNYFHHVSTPTDRLLASVDKGGPTANDGLLSGDESHPGEVYYETDRGCSNSSKLSLSNPFPTVPCAYSIRKDDLSRNSGFCQDGTLIVDEDYRNTLIEDASTPQLGPESFEFRQMRAAGGSPVLRSISVDYRGVDQMTGSQLSSTDTLIHQSSSAMRCLLAERSNLNRNLGNHVGKRGILSFVMQIHDLKSLRFALSFALRKAVLRVHALQALNWLLRTMTSEEGIHDVLWYFIASLTPNRKVHGSKHCMRSSLDLPRDYKNLNTDQTDGEQENKPYCTHPVLDLQLSGENAVQLIADTFHSFLLSVSSILPNLPQNTIVQLLAIRCWSVHVLPSDHQFLHSSEVFSHVSKILSKLETRDTRKSLPRCKPMMKMMPKSASGLTLEMVPSSQHPRVLIRGDITEYFLIKPSSHDAIAWSLTDGSTETFWESDEKDKAKFILITPGSDKVPEREVFVDSVHVHVDNTRDVGEKVTSIAFFVEDHEEATEAIFSSQIDIRFAGWISCLVQKGSNSIKKLKVRLKGLDNNVRVRQLQVLGQEVGKVANISSQNDPSEILSHMCEVELLKVFKLLTAEVFGHLLEGSSALNAEFSPVGLNKDAMMPVSAPPSPQGVTDDNLMEHMVGILFRGSKLSKLQKQIFSHIVEAIAVESSRMKHHWELEIKPSAQVADVYCFQLLSMVLALSGSEVGRHYVAKQTSLILDLTSVLHTGTPRIQRQVCSLLRRILPEVTPKSFVRLVSSNDMLCSELATKLESSGMNNVRIGSLVSLDVFLICIAKCLTVQVKGLQSPKISAKAGSKQLLRMSDVCSNQGNTNDPAQWWIQGVVKDPSIPSITINLLTDMASGRMGEAWRKATRTFIADTLMSLTRLSEEEKSPSEMVESLVMWKALAALCILDPEHVIKLSSVKSGQNQEQLICNNHDDGITMAVVKCGECGNLCADCDHYLHLNRRTKLHQRQILKEEQQAVQVELHEGCGRIKLYWIMALVDSRTLKAVIEFTNGPGHYSSLASAACRFCGRRSEKTSLYTNNVCDDGECLQYAESACPEVHPCGHLCMGVNKEATCLPCLHPSCTPDLKQDVDDMCMVCFTDAISRAPAIQLSCGHIFHFHCCKTQLEKRWSGPRITFGFTLCSICKSEMVHASLACLLLPIRQMKIDIERKALIRLEYEGLKDCEAIVLRGRQFYQDPVGFALSKYSYYLCFKCGKAYYGGEVRCDAEAAVGGDENFDPTELVCGACSDVSCAQICPKHGMDFLEYKCRFCCSVAVYFCFGTTHFCQPCHDDFQRVTALPKDQLPRCPVGPKSIQLPDSKCPLHVDHPSTGEEYALGCGICRNANTF